MFFLRKSGVLVLAMAPLVLAQTQTNQATQAKNINYSNMPFTRPVKTGTSQPVTCTVGDLFFNTSATAGQNLYACTAPNTWALETGGGSSSAGDSNGDLQRNNSGALGAANINQNSDGSLNASAAVTEPAPYTPVFNSGGITTCDLSKSTTCQLNANGPTTLAILNAHGSGPFHFITVTDAGGPYAISVPSTFIGAPGFSATASSTEIVSCVYDGSLNFTCGYSEAPSVIRMTTERSLPAAPSSGSACVPDSTGHMLRCINSSGATFAVAKEISGVRKGNGADAVDTAAAAADIVNLFSGCSGTQYLGADGNCHGSSGGGGSTYNVFQGPGSAVSMNGTDVTVLQQTSVPALAAGSCYSIEFGLGATLASGAVKLYVDSTAITTVVPGASSSELTITLRYCNQQGSTTAQNVVYPIPAFYCTTTGCFATNSSNLGSGGNLVGSLPSINWASSHTISITVNQSSGSVVPSYLFIKL